MSDGISDARLAEIRMRTGVYGSRTTMFTADHIEVMRELERLRSLNPQPTTDELQSAKPNMPDRELVAKVVRTALLESILEVAARKAEADERIGVSPHGCIGDALDDLYREAVSLFGEFKGNMNPKEAAAALRAAAERVREGR